MRNKGQNGFFLIRDKLGPKLLAIKLEDVLIFMFNRLQFKGIGGVKMLDDLNHFPKRNLRRAIGVSH